MGSLKLAVTERFDEFGLGNRARGIGNADFSGDADNRWRCEIRPIKERVIIEHLAWRTVGDDIAVVHDTDTIGEFGGKVKIVCREHDRDALDVDLPDAVFQQRRPLGIKSRKRFIKDDHTRIKHENARESDKALFAATEVMRNPILKMTRVEPIQSLAGTSARIFGANALVTEPEHNVIKDSRRNQLGVRILKDEADLLSGILLRVRINCLAVDLEVAVVGHERCIEMLKEGGLTGSVAANDRDNLVRIDGEVDLMDADSPIGIGVGAAVKIDQRIGTHTPITPRWNSQ